MKKSFVVQQVERPGLTFLKISGVIDETFQPNELLPQVSSETIIHLGRVTRFSSFGVREWLTFVRAVKARVRHCLLVECSPAVIRQVNMVADFAAGAHVKSLQLPYVCTDCNHDALLTIDVDIQREGLMRGVLPPLACARCGKPMVFDDVAEDYFSFLSNVQPPAPGSALAEFVRHFESAAPELTAEPSPPGAPVAGAREGSVAVDPQSAAPPVGAVSGPNVAAAPVASPGGSNRRVVITAAVAAVLLVVALAGAWTVWRPAAAVPVAPPTSAAKEPVVPPTPAPTPPPAPPAAPERRALKAAEVLELNELIAAERFDDCEQMISALDSELDEAGLVKLAEMMRSGKQTAAAGHLLRAKALGGEGRPRDGLAELQQAFDLGLKSEEAMYQKVLLFRRALDCTALTAAANDFRATFPRSSLMRKVNAVRRDCLVAARQRAPERTPADSRSSQQEPKAATEPTPEATPAP